MKAKNAELLHHIDTLKDVAAKELLELQINYESKISMLTPKQNECGPELLKLILDDFLMKSGCVSDDQQKQYLIMLLGNKRLVTTLLYRASEHGWQGKDFHDRCDQKGATLSLFKVRDGDCIGGYTNA